MKLISSVAALALSVITASTAFAQTFPVPLPPGTVLGCPDTGQSCYAQPPGHPLFPIHLYLSQVSLFRFTK
jgi:hypothetical protein